MAHAWKSLWKSECGRTVPIYRVLVPDSVNEEILAAWKARGYRYTAGAPSAIMLTGGMSRNFFRSSVLFKGGTAAGTDRTRRGQPAPLIHVWILCGDAAVLFDSR